MIEVIKLKTVNCHIIKNEENEEILVDTGSKDDREELVELLKKRKIKALLLTHGHINQLDNVKYLTTKYKCQVYMHKDDFDLIKNSFARELYADSFIGKVLKNRYIKKCNGKLEQSLNDVVFVENGDNFEKIGFQNVKLIHLPGHTRGSIGVLEDRKHLIVGDTMMNYFKPTKSLFYEEKASLLNSIEKIKDIGPLKIYPSCGNTFEYSE